MRIRIHLLLCLHYSYADPYADKDISSAMFTLLIERPI